MRATTPLALLRPLRAAVLAGVGVGLGAGGHALVSGTVPPLPLLALIALGFAGAACIAMERELGSRAILVALAVAQALTHGAGLLAHGGHLGVTGGSSSLLCRLQAGAPSGTRSALAIALMVLAHAAATLAAVWWLRRGEAWAWSRLRASARAVRRLIGRLPRPLPALAALLCLRHAPAAAPLPVRSRPADGRGRSRRGPPALLLAPAA